MKQLPVQYSASCTHLPKQNTVLQLGTLFMPRHSKKVKWYFSWFKSAQEKKKSRGRQIWPWCSNNILNDNEPTRRGRHCPRGERDSNYWMYTSRCGWNRMSNGPIICWVDQWSPLFPPAPWICEIDLLKKLEYNCFTMLCCFCHATKKISYMYT